MLSARALTGARYGMIATVDDAGEIEEFIASGLSDDERRQMEEWPHGYAFFEHLRDLPGALRLRAEFLGMVTATEYELLRVLSRNAGRVSSHEDLLRQVWGGRHYGDTELVRTFVKNLRRKLGDDAASPAYIVNQRGVGYRMARPDDA